MACSDSPKGDHCYHGGDHFQDGPKKCCWCGFRPIGGPRPAHGPHAPQSQFNR